MRITIKNLRELLKNLHCLLKNQSNQSINKSHLIHLSSSNCQALSFVQFSFKTNLIMLSHLFTEERFKEFRNRFSQISDADSSKS